MQQSQEVMNRETSIEDQYDRSYTEYNSTNDLYKMLMFHHKQSYDGHIPSGFLPTYDVVGPTYDIV